MDPRAEQILPSPLGKPKLRPRRLTSILWGRGDQPRPTAHGLGGGGLRGGPGIGGRSMWLPGHLPYQGCLCDAGEPPLPGVLDEGGRRVCPAVGLRNGWSPVGAPPVHPPGGVCSEGRTRVISHADHCPGMARPLVSVVDHAVRPVPQAVAAAPGPAPLPASWHGPDASPQVANVGLPDGIPRRGRSHARPHHPSQPSSHLWPPQGRSRHGARTRARNSCRRTATQTRCPSGVGPGRCTASGTCNASTPPAQPGAPLPHIRPPGTALSRWCPRRDTSDSLPPAGGGAIKLGRPAACRNSLGRSCPRGQPGDTAGDRPGSCQRGRAGGRRGSPTGPPPRGPDGNRP